MQHSHRPETASASERHTEDILDGIGDAFFGLDRDWRMVYFNRVAEKFFGKLRHQMLGKVLWDLYPELVGSEFEHQYRRVMTTQEPVEFQADSIIRPGRWLDLRAFPTRHGLGVSFRDVTDRHHTSEELRHQLGLTRTFTDNTAEALFLIDERGRVSFMNPAAERMFGFSADEMLGHMLHDMFHHHYPDGRPYPVSECPLANLVSINPGLKVHDDLFFRKDGSALAVSYSSAPVYKEGRLIGTALVVRDVTEQKRREAALRESEARFRVMADSVPALLWMTDEEGQVTFANMHYEHMFGRPTDEMLGGGWIEDLLPEDSGPFVEAFQDAFRKRAFFHGEMRIKDRHGRVRWLRCDGVPRFDDTGIFLGYTGCDVDITEVKAADEHQRLLINELNHRVKNTLATVQSIASQTLRNAQSPSQARQDFEVRLFALSHTHNVLTRENWQGVHLHEIVDGAIDPYRHRGTSRFKVKGPEFRLPPRMALPLAMAFHELSTNAVKYGALSNATGRIDITWAVSSQAEGRHLVLRWSESGGPPVEPPSRRGFGSRLIERSLAQDLGGEVRIEFPVTGVVCTVDVAVDDANPAGSSQPINTD